MAALGAEHWPVPLPPPPTDPAAPRRALIRVLPELLESRPQAAALVGDLWRLAETATAEERVAPPWARSEGRAEAAWTRALVAALRARRELHTEELRLANQWRELADRIGPAVEAARTTARSASLGKREIAAAEQARVEWRLSQQLAATGKYAPALEAGSRAEHWIRVVAHRQQEVLARFADPSNLRLWRRWAAEAIEHSRKQREVVFVVDKLRRRLEVFSAGIKIETFPAEIGSKGLQRKLHSGDRATPEGHYQVTELRGPGQTQYYKALMLSYPNAEDRNRFAAAIRRGELPRRARIGGLIEIHGDGGQGRDWTDGCVALANTDMDKIFDLARMGTRVTIVGTY